MTTSEKLSSQPGVGTPAPDSGQVVMERITLPAGTVAILVPVLNRPHNVVPLMRSIFASTHVRFRVCFILDPVDDLELLAVEDACADYIFCDGNYAKKINMAARRAREPYLFLGADDLNFHDGWFPRAASLMSGGKIQVVGTNDLCNPKVIAGDHATHFLVRRNYLLRGTIDEPNKLLHEGYEHEWVDNEFIETAKSRDVYAHCHKSVVEHLHPMAGKAHMDKLYAGMPRRMATGRVIFQRRRKLWT